MGDTRRLNNYVIAGMRAKREALGVSQDKLSIRAGFSHHQINRWEGGHNSPSIESVCIYLQALGFRLDIVADDAPAPEPVASMIVWE